MPRPRIYTSNADRQRAYRQRHKPKPIKLPPAPLLEVGGEGRAVAEWSASRLVVPPGHPRAGQPFALPPFLVAFISDALTRRESLLCIARKNAKSAAAAVLLLAYLVGPLRRPGFRAGIVSVNRAKAGELMAQMQAIATASNLAGLDFWKSPAPGWVQGPEGRVDILSADRSAGHASGFDLSIIDELGLLAERDRELVAGMRTATSAKDGRFLALTIHGSGPFVGEILDRRGEPGLAIHHHAADPDAKLDDPQAWKAANPGLGTIKSLSYMESEARRVLATPGDQQHFRAHDLNVPASPTVELICGLDDWKACLAPEDELPARSGWCTIGLDLGASASMTAACAVWQSGRVESWAAFPSSPGLAARGRKDGVGGLYAQMQAEGCLKTYDGRVTPVGPFLHDVAERLAGAHVVSVGADRFRKEEAVQALAAVPAWIPRLVRRGTGASATADGSHDVRAFQRGVLRQSIRSAPNRALSHAIAESSIRYDSGGNPALDKAKSKSRTDPLQAAVIAVGLAELQHVRRVGGARVTVLGRAS